MVNNYKSMTKKVQGSSRFIFSSLQKVLINAKLTMKIQLRSLKETLQATNIIERFEIKKIKPENSQIC